MTASTGPKVIALEMAEHISGLFPPPLISADGTQATMKPLSLVSVEKDRNIWPGGRQLCVPPCGESGH
jgi:hypothetical protein